MRQESERTDNLSLQGGLPGFRYQAQGPDGRSLAILSYLHFINTSFFYLYLVLEFLSFEREEKSNI